MPARQERCSPSCWLFAGAGCSEFAQRRAGRAARIDYVRRRRGARPRRSHIPNTPTDARICKTTRFRKRPSSPDREAPAVRPRCQEQAVAPPLYQRATRRTPAWIPTSFVCAAGKASRGKKKPEELIRVQFRNEPFSVHLKWLGDEGKGRETIYVKGKYDNEMQVLLAANDAFPFSPAGFR